MVRKIHATPVLQDWEELHKAKQELKEIQCGRSHGKA
jgi:hypothetical protein